MLAALAPIAVTLLFGAAFQLVVLLVRAASVSQGYQIALDSGAFDACSRGCAPEERGPGLRS
jgi:hypothetical protein